MADSTPGAPRICWLASYPRSGNTWVRFLLTAYFLGSADSGEVVATTVPDLHTSMKAVGAISGRAFVKTHYAWGPRHPFASDTDRAIVLLRHPGDVLLSCIGLHRAMGSAGRSGSFSDAAYAREFLQNGGDRDWLDKGFGTWSSHADSWLNNGTFPVLAVRYESLRREPAAELTRMLTFAGHPAHPGRIAAAVETCSIHAMRDMEMRDKRAGKRGAFRGSKAAMERGHAFVGPGRVGATLDGIEPGLDRAMKDRFGADIVRLLSEAG